MKLNDDKVYIIAEIGGNFTTYEQAMKLIDCANDCGVDAVKLQTYRADTVSSTKAMFNMENVGITSQYELFKRFEIGKELHRQVFDYAKSKDLDVFSTPAHITDVELLDEIGCDIYKVGSDDAVNIPFLRYLAGTGKPIILATGMCTLEEVKESVSAILGESNSQLYLLHAITAYPTHAEDVNLDAMVTMINVFPNIKIGYSDHTSGTAAAICAAAMGAKIIEKHFTYDKNANGPDHMLSASPEEMSYIVKTIREFEIIKGSGIKMPSIAEKTNRINNRKSIVITRNVKKGECLTKDNIDIKRPGFGIQPKYFEQVIGRTVSKDLAHDDILQWEDLS